MTGLCTGSSPSHHTTSPVVVDVVGWKTGSASYVVRNQTASTGSAALVRTRTVTVAPSSGASSET